MASTERFTPYSAYRESGVEWLGEIPAHWTCLSLARVTRSRCDGPFGSGLKSQHYSLDGVRVIRLQNIGEPEFLNSDQVFVDESHADALGNHSVLQGDLLIAGLGDDAHPVGRACVAPEGLGRAMVKADCFRFRLDPKEIVPGFAAYQLSANALAASGYLATGSTRSRVNLSTTATRKIALPPVAEQHAIVSFLNRETAKFGAMVTKKGRLIELLQEKRTALITGAVTKGIDTDAPLKDSGVEWLADIPEGWNTARMWQLSEAISGGTPSRDESGYWGGSIPWVSPKDMKRRLIDDTEEKITERGRIEGGLRLVRPPAVLIVVRGMILAHSFPVALAAVPLTINQDMKALKLDEGVDARYFGWLLDGISHQILAAVIEKSGHGTRAVRMDQWRSVELPLPPILEQRSVADFLDRETTKMDALVTKVREAIDRLKELRTALIAAAVTGKIDVRETPA